MKEQLSEKPGDVDALLIRIDVRALDAAAILLSRVEVDFLVGESTSPEFSETSAMFVESPIMIPVSISRFESTEYLLATRLRSLAEPDEPIWYFGSKSV